MTRSSVKKRWQHAVVTGAALAGFAVAFGTASAQETAPAFAAGGLSNWGTDVAGPKGGAVVATPDAGRAADAPQTGKPKSKATSPGTRKAPPKVADDKQGASEAAGKAPPPKFTPASVTPRGPIIVRPPNAAAAAAPAATPAQKATAAGAAAIVPPATKLAPGDCLAVNQIGPGTFQIENAGCNNAPVLATIEIRNGSRSITCYIARIRDAYAVTSPAGAPPRINHQCRDGAPGCTEPALKGMFPECRGSV